MSATPYKIENHGPRQWRLLRNDSKRGPEFLACFASHSAADRVLMELQALWLNLVESERRHLERDAVEG